MASSRAHSTQAACPQPRDLLIDYEPTPPTSPRSPQLSTPELSCNPSQARPNMPVYSYHRGHQSMDYGQGNWRSPNFGSPGTQVVPSHVVPGAQDIWTATPSQRHPRYTQWRSHDYTDNPSAEEVRRIMAMGTDAPTTVAFSSANQYAYCLDRGNGQMTRLIPADMLPALNGIPRLESQKLGMAILPQPTAAPPPHVPATNQIVTVHNPNNINGPVSGSATPTPSIASPHRQHREKKWCTKWIHEGTCAFVHTGCRYKHDMPMDRATQLEVGLYTGLPTWWKNRNRHLNNEQKAKHSDVAQQQQPPNMQRPSISGQRPGFLSGSTPDGPWRKGDGDVRAGHRASRSGQDAPYLRHKPGPIGPPGKDK